MKKIKKTPNPHKALSDAEWNALGSVMHGVRGLPKEAQAAVKRSIGRPPAEYPKERITVRLDQDVLAVLRATGKGWQTRMNQVLKTWAKRQAAYATT